MKILIVSDEESPYIWDYFDPAPFKEVDLMISCGDLDPRYLSFLATMIPAPLLYVHGNHDKTYLRVPPEGCTSIDGSLYVHKGVRILGFGGSMSQRVAPFEYTEQQMRKRVNKRKWDIFRNGGVDILVTHAPASGLGDIPGTFHQGFQTFRDVLEKHSPKYHFYGHVHPRYGRKIADITYGRTQIINAVGYKIIEY